MGAHEQVNAPIVFVHSPWSGSQSFSPSAHSSLSTHCRVVVFHAKPLGHWHRKEPNVLLHSACRRPVLVHRLPSLHSSASWHCPPSLVAVVLTSNPGRHGQMYEPSVFLHCVVTLLGQGARSTSVPLARTVWSRLHSSISVHNVDDLPVRGGREKERERKRERETPQTSDMPIA